jgi:ankyrin repeat protein
MYEEHDGVDQFLNQHPTLNLNSPKGDNLPLHRACLTSSVTRTLKRLLEAGASPDARCSYISQDARFNYTDGYNAIQCMMVNGGPMKSDVVECLKEKSINPETYLTLRDEKVKATPLQLAVELGHIEGVQLLVEAGTYKTLTDAEKRDLVRSAGGSNLEIVKYLLENEPVSILNDASNDGAQSCLGKAILWNRTDIVQWLLERGADPNIKVESESETAKGVVEKRTPWDLALKNTYFELCGVLSLMEWKNSFIEMSDISEADELVDHTKEYDQNSWWFNIEGNNVSRMLTKCKFYYND